MHKPRDIKKYKINRVLYMSVECIWISFVARKVKNTLEIIHNIEIVSNNFGSRFLRTKYQMTREFKRIEMSFAK